MVIAPVSTANVRLFRIGEFYLSQAHLQGNSWLGNGAI